MTPETIQTIRMAPPMISYGAIELTTLRKWLKLATDNQRCPFDFASRAQDGLWCKITNHRKAVVDGCGRTYIATDWYDYRETITDPMILFILESMTAWVISPKTAAAMRCFYLGAFNAAFHLKENKS